MLDVLVIGAGAAGLTAAYKLQQADQKLKIVLLEAQGRVGGRTLTQAVDIGNGRKDMFDLGGQWVASSQTHVMDMMKELGLESYPQYTSGIKTMQLGSDNKIRTYSSDIPSLGSWWALVELQLFIWRVEWMVGRTPITDPYSGPYAKELEGHSVDSFARKHISSVAALQAIDIACKAALGSDSTQVSALFLLANSNAAGGLMKLLETKQEAAQEARVKGGTQQISELLAKKLGKDVVLLNHPVVAISQTKEDVTVETENGTRFVARRVIVTAPSNILAKIKFSPPLPPYKKLLYETLPMGHLIKFIVIYKQAFWREKGYSGEIVSHGGDSELHGVSSGPLSACFDATNDKGTPAIVGFIAGRQSVEWEQKTEKERREAVLESLVAFLGPEARHCVSYNEKVWAEEPYVGGCPVVYGVPGIMYSFPHLRMPFERLHFAGTETATAWTGFISGAIQSGKRAATEVLYNLRPSLISDKDLKGTCYDNECIPRDRKIDRSESNYRIFTVTVFVAIFAVLCYNLFS